MEMHFVSLFFLNERNITNSLLMIHLKCTIVHCDNLNSSSINKPYLRAIEYSFFFLTFYVYFNKAFIKTFMEKLPFFNTDF